MRPPHRLRDALLIAGAALALTAATAAGAPAASAAPAPPPAPAAPASPLGAAGPEAEPHAARPGDVLRAEPQPFKPNPVTPSDARSWKVHYRSTTADGAPTTVSGTVIVPSDGRTGPRPVVGYAVGTVGLADHCAPSRTFPDGLTKEGTLIQQALDQGWAVAVTDYEGLGTPGVHTYTVGRSAGHALLDVVRAAFRLPQAGLADDAPVGLMGYSQGGQASSWAAQLHAAYAPELDVRGVTTGGVPRDLLEVAEFNDGRAGAGLIVMAAVGHDAAFPELELDRYLNERGREQVRLAKSHCVEVNTATFPFGRIDDVTTTNPLQEPDWRRRLGQSELGRTAPAAPVYLYHGALDTLIPYRAGTELRDMWRTRGADVTFTALPLGHVTGATVGFPGAVSWLDQRLTG
ncbi:lipase [Streptomyces sp. JJ66]|uniref:lipase family protein n=1 Tax=Streptomyces sp. JJ66 TaxID=2803843 RepID=UPI001C5827A5|nr:lipase family protein [Streptomyces sp. JJ66]MBW1602705.1 lipase [Streptomyces sp. JJ66]